MRSSENYKRSEPVTQMDEAMLEKARADFEKAKTITQSEKAESPKEYGVVARKHGLLSYLEITKSPFYKNWADFVGRDGQIKQKRVEINGSKKNEFDSANEESRRLDREEYIKTKQINKNPKNIYREIKKESKLQNKEEYEELKNKVQEDKDINSSGDYIDFSIARNYIPYYNLVTSPFFEGWDVFLKRNKEETERIYLKKLKKEVQDLGIKSITGYLKEYPLHDDWISIPTIKKNREFKGWDDFFGRLVGIDALIADVEEKGVTDEAEYIEMAPLYGWPKDWNEFLEMQKEKTQTEELDKTDESSSK